MRRTLQAASAILIMIVGLLAATATAQGMYTQSPFLDAMVADGTLPPVDERLPLQPMVYEYASEVGTYGGQFNVFSLANHPWNDLTEEPARGPFILLLTEDGEFVPDVALEYSMDENFEVVTIKLREGMQWSNGDPFTSEDFKFKLEYMGEQGWNSEFGTADAFVEAPDPYTVIIHQGESRPRTWLNMVHWRGGEWTMFNPSAYLKRWHPEFTDDAELVAIEEGFQTWEEAFNWHSYWNPLNDVNKPTTQMWDPEELSSTGRLYHRNPYFHQVDTAGQQLPYVDTVLSQLVDPETYQLKIIAGEADLAWGSASFSNYTLYKENEVASNYVVSLIPAFKPAEVTFLFNFSHPNPVYHELFNTVEFRQALSIAIDRDEINDVVLAGFAKPQQWTITEFSPLYKEEWGRAWAQFDPDLANSVLDDLGLTERDSNGIRLGSDGKPLVFVVLISAEAQPAAVQIYELVQEYWGDLGLRIEIRGIPTATNIEIHRAMEWDIVSGRDNNGEMYTTILGGSGRGMIGVNNWWWQIYREAEGDIAAGRKTLADYADGVIPGEEPPAEFTSIFDKRQALTLTLFGSPEYTALATEMLQELSDGLYGIGTVAQTPIVFISRPNIGNLPTDLMPWLEGVLDLNHFSNTWYYKTE